MNFFLTIKNRSSLPVDISHNIVWLVPKIGICSSLRLEFEEVIVLISLSLSCISATETKSMLLYTFNVSIHDSLSATILSDPEIF